MLDYQLDALVMRNPCVKRKSGVKGVSWDKRAQKWRAIIGTNDRLHPNQD